ncbi:MAG: DUF4043 family protein [Caulobacteraceae bacterium]|nr:DUF4043 family protein [Caulobacteraceae bacterium]
MAEVVLATASQRQTWVTTYFQEYVRQSRFMPYMTNADLNKGGIILTRFELQDGAGKTINIPFIGRLKAAGVTGATVLDGAEEDLTNYNMPVAVDWRRNGVRVPKSTSFMTEINLLNAAKDALQVWEAEKIRDDIIKAFMQAVIDLNGGVANWDVATAAQKNFWTAANSDRILFGNLISNYSATFLTGAGNVAAAAKASVANISLAKRIAKIADPRIRPFRATGGDGREFYVAFHGARTFRDLKADSTMVTANTQARARESEGMKDNPIFQDGDLLYDGIIHREVPEIDDYAAIAGLNGIGAASADIRPIFVCGGGAAAIAWGQEPTPRTDYVKDYGFRPGVAIEELLGVKKINFNGVQNGIVTMFVGAAADS